MTNFDNTNRGILFGNDRKEKDTQPDYRGKLNVEGKEYWISGWDKQTKAGPGISLSIQPAIAKKDTGYKKYYKVDGKDQVHEVDEGEINLQDIPF